MQIGDVVAVQHDGATGRGRVEAIRDGRAYVRLSIRRSQPWASTFTGGTVPPGCPVTYALWVDVATINADGEAARDWPASPHTSP